MGSLGHELWPLAGSLVVSKSLLVYYTEPNVTLVLPYWREGGTCVFGCGVEAAEGGGNNGDPLPHTLAVPGALSPADECNLSE